MRSLFTAFCKVLGLFLLYRGLLYIASLPQIIQTLGQSSGHAFWSTAFGPIGLSILSITAMMVLTFGFAWLLLCRTEWLGDKLKLSDQDNTSPISSDTIIKAGTLLLGLFFTLQAAPALIGSLAKVLSAAAGHDRMIRYQMFSGLWTSVLPSALKLVLGLLLVFKTEGVLKWIESEKADRIPDIH